MAASAIEIIGGIVLSTTITVNYTGAANQSAQIAQMVLFNSDTVNAHLVSIWFAPGTGTPALKDQLGAFIVPAGQSLSVYQAIKLIIPTGSTIQTQCDLNGVVSMKASANILT